MTTERVETAEALTKRIRRLLRLDQPKGDQNELSLKVLPDLRSLGSVALIGGAIRDVALGGKRCFASDLDFVVYDTDRAAFAERMQSWGSVRNKFGGYAVTRFNCKVDLWHIDDTWAKTAGHVDVVRPNDLLRCTFFDWDSAIYELGTGKLTTAPGYLDRLRLNVMDVCLEPNPNHTGALVRALRRAACVRVSIAEPLRCAVMDLQTLVLGIAGLLHRGTPSQQVVTAIVDGCEHETKIAPTDVEACVALVTVYVALESSYLTNPIPWSWDAKAGRSCGILQLPVCSLPSSPARDVMTWLSMVRRSSLASVDSSSKRAAQRSALAERLLREARGR